MSNYTPEATSDLPVIGVYYVFNIGFVSVSVGTSVCVLNFHFRGHKVKPVPSWLKTLLFIHDEKLVVDPSEFDDIKKYHRNKNTSKDARDNLEHHNYTCPAISRTNALNEFTIDPTIPTYLLNKTTVITTSNSINRVVSPQLSPGLQISPHKKQTNRNTCSPMCIHNQFTNEVKFDMIKNKANSNLYSRPFYTQNNDLVQKISGDENEVRVRVIGDGPSNNQTNSLKSNAVKKETSNSNYSTLMLEDKKEDSLEMIIKLIKKSIRLIEKARIKSNNMQLINDDWKEVASRLDLIFFVIACSIVTATPVFLFGKFFLQNGLLEIATNRACGCAES